MAERRSADRQLSMRLVGAVEGVARSVSPTPGLRMAYQVGHVALRPIWLVTRPKVVGTKVVVRCGRDVLLLRHSYARRKQWDLPGGFVQPGERAVDAVYRELEEELGIEPVSIRRMCRESAVNDHKRETLLTFVAEVEDRAITPSRAEIDFAEWFPDDRLPEQATPFARRMIARADWMSPIHGELPTR